MRVIYVIIVAFSLLSVTSLIVTFTFLTINTSSTFKLTESDLITEWIIDTGHSSLFPPVITNINDDLLYGFFPAGDRAGFMQLQSSTSRCEFRLSSPENIKRIFGVAGMMIGAIAVAVIKKGYKEDEEILKVYTISNRYFCSISHDIAIPFKHGIGDRRGKIFGYQNTFDVFFKNDAYCGLGHLCRLSYNTGGFPINNSVVSEFTSMSRDWGIDVVDKRNPSSGYFYMELDEDHKYRIVKLDYNKLTVVSTRRWNKIRLYSAIQGRVTLCEDNTELDMKCTMLDSNLNNIATALIPMDENLQLAGPLELFNTPDGGAIIFYALRGKRKLLYNKDAVYTYIRIIGSDGTVGKLIKFFDHNICEKYEIDVQQVFGGLCFRLQCLEGNSFSVKCIVRQ